MSKLSVILVLSIVLFKNFHCSNSSDLLSVVAIYRHGARAPRGTYRNDPYKDNFNWGAEIGHLTNTGKWQLYELGKWFRQRYDGFLPRKYFSSDIQVTSSDKDRCLMSAAACLAGLYPPEGNQIWNEDLLWQPIPIRMVPQEEDAILKMRKRCAKHERLYNEELKKRYMQDIMKENQELFNYLSKKSGENISTLLQMKDLYDIFRTQSYYNITLPDWAKDVYRKMECLAIFERTSHTCTTELARLRCGPLIDVIISHFESVIKKEDVPKFLMYSSHDTTLVNVMNSMKIYDHQWPDFAAVLIFELRKDNEKHFVNILYKKATGLVKLNLNGCSFDCDIEKFKQTLAPIRVNLRDWVRECFE